MIPILCYHKVGPVAEEGRFLNVEPTLLDAHLAFLRRRQLTFVRAGELAELFPSRAVCLTFDDAYHSALTWGLEALRRHGATATFYAVSSLVGSSSSWDGPKARPLARWALLREAQRAGFEIGNHTKDHPDLSRLTYDEQVAQWREADEAFLREGLAPESCCYPFGRLGPQSTEAARSAGAKIALALGKRPAKAEDDRLRLPRIVMAYSDKVPKFMYKLYIRPRMP